MAVLFFLATMAVSNATAQELRGIVRGVVTDPTGALVLGAAVTLSNDNTGVEVHREANQRGQYIFDFVSPGTYTLRVEAGGFRTFVQRNILVQTRGDVTVNAKLVLGAVTEQVTVEAAPVAVSFSRTTMETTVDTKMTNSLPLINRNPFLLAQLNPAVNYTGGVETSPYHHWAGTQLDVGGNTSEKNDILMDGSPQMVGSKSTYTPTMDAVSEVSVQQNAVDAEFGHSAGGIISMQMKSGTNDFHGTAYYYGRNPALNAVSDSTTHTPNTIKNHAWGFTSQNPFVRNKIFNFFAYEGTNMRDARTQKYTLPTQLERAGDFSQTWVRAGQVRTIFDPLTSAFDAAKNIAPRQPFPGNRVPQARIDSTALRFLKDIWAPNNSDNLTGANNYVITGPMQFKYWNMSDRADYYVSDSVKVFGRVSIFKTIQTEKNFVNSPALRKSGSERNTAQVQADMVWTINPTTVFNIRGMGSKFTDSFYDADMIIKGYEEFWPGNQWYQEYMAELPAIYYPGLQIRGATTSSFGRDGFWFQEPMGWNIQSKLSKQVGAHYIKIGGEFRQMKNNCARPRPMGFYFDRAETSNDGLSPDTAKYGGAWATFLLGIPASSSRIQNVALNDTRHESYGFYFQDDLKLTQRITLNLGLRYEYETALKDPGRRLSRYLDLTQPIPEFQGVGAPRMPAEVTAISGGAPKWNGAWVFTDDSHPGAWDTPRNTFLPRAGLAYRVNDRTAVRIGYARYATPSTVERAGDIQILGSIQYPGYEALTNTLGTLQGIPRTQLSDPYPSGGANPNPLVRAVGKSLGRYTRLGDSVLWFRPDMKLGISERINFSLQRQIWNRFVVDLTWFMNFGYNQANFLEGNEYLPNLGDPRYGFKYGAAVSKSVANPFYGILTPQKFPGPLRNTKNVTVGSLLVPYPHYRTLEQSPAGDVSSRYQALQLQVQRPFANGFNMLLGYNYNRAREQTYFDNQDRFDGIYSWFDGYKPRHKLTLASIYEFPFGHGRRWGSGWHAATDAILGGWSVSGIFQYRSGWLLSFGEDLVTGDPRIDNPTRTRWFDTSVFQKQPAYTRRTNPRQYSGLTGPRYQNLDFTVQKMFKLTEKVSFEFRMEAYNMSNSFMGANPSTSRTSSTFGQVVNQLTTHRGREMQYSGRFYW